MKLFYFIWPQYHDNKNTVYFIFRFHLTCIQKLAVNSGYFFKCPMCNNKDEFEAEMKKFGIYIPEQDAAWEREGNIYDGIYERHGTCDAENCKSKSLSKILEQ